MTCPLGSFPDAELMRYAAAAGYLEADSAERRAAALTGALERIGATSNWLQVTSFMRPREMRAWGHVVRIRARM